MAVLQGAHFKVLFSIFPNLLPSSSHPVWILLRPLSFPLLLRKFNLQKIEIYRVVERLVASACLMSPSGCMIYLLSTSIS
jgi:hypothetical protein